MRISFLEKKNRDIKESIKLVEDGSKSPTRVAKVNKKHVASVERAKNVALGPNQPSVKICKSKFKYVQQMKQIDQAPRRTPFNQWKQYQRCMEELEESKDQVNQFRQQNMVYKNYIQRILENCDHEVREKSKSLYRSKHLSNGPSSKETMQKFVCEKLGLECLVEKYKARLGGGSQIVKEL